MGSRLRSVSSMLTGLLCWLPLATCMAPMASGQGDTKRDLIFQAESIVDPAVRLMYCQEVHLDPCPGFMSSGKSTLYYYNYTKSSNQSGTALYDVTDNGTSSIKDGSPGSFYAAQVIQTPTGISVDLTQSSGFLHFEGFCSTTQTCTLKSTNSKNFNISNFSDGTLTFTQGPNGLAVSGFAYVNYHPSSGDVTNIYGFKLAVITIWDPYTGRWIVLTDDPIATGSGELTSVPPPMLNLGGPLAQVFQIGYSSFLNINGDQSLLGYNWNHSFDVVLQVAGANAVVKTFGGGSVKFTQSGSNWTATPNSRVAYQLLASANGYKFMDPERNLIFSFDSMGRLTAIQDRNSNTLTVTQSTSGPTQVSDGLGRTFTFTYSGGFLTKVLDQSGRGVSFAYTGNNMTGVTDALGNTTTYAYQS